MRVLYGCTAAGLVRPYSGGYCTVVQVSTTVWLSCYKPMWKILKRCGKDAFEAYGRSVELSLRRLCQVALFLLNSLQTDAVSSSLVARQTRIVCRSESYYATRMRRWRPTLLSLSYVVSCWPRPSWTLSRPVGRSGLPDTPRPILLMLNIRSQPTARQALSQPIAPIL